MKDLTNKRFGCMMTISPTSDREESNIIWKCQCDCGNTFTRSSARILKAKKLKQNQSCGCVQSKDFTGKRYKMLTAIRKLHTVKNKGWLWLFQCDCGNTVERFGSNVFRGESISNCGCVPKEFTRKIDLTGKRFGKLTVLAENGRSNEHVVWKCECDCGNMVNVRGQYLTRGKSHCGCVPRKITSNMIKLFPETEISYTIWNKIKHNARVRNLELTITPEYIWEQYLKQDKCCNLTGDVLILHPTKHRTASLDRINSDDGYVQGNVQWVTKEVNIFKMALSEKHLITLCRKIYEHSIRTLN